MLECLLTNLIEKLTKTPYSVLLLIAICIHFLFGLSTDSPNGNFIQQLQWSITPSLAVAPLYLFCIASVITVFIFHHPNKTAFSIGSTVYQGFSNGIDYYIANYHFINVSKKTILIEEISIMDHPYIYSLKHRIFIWLCSFGKFRPKWLNKLPKVKSTVLTFTPHELGKLIKQERYDIVQPGYSCDFGLNFESPFAKLFIDQLEKLGKCKLYWVVKTADDCTVLPLSNDTRTTLLKQRATPVFLSMEEDIRDAAYNIWLRFGVCNEIQNWEMAKHQTYKSKIKQLLQGL